ncbi:MAG TPA: helix-turn-helix domain-containing protein [Galbitalea sp.]|jgi:AraC-like DNA-binding protein
MVVLLDTSLLPPRERSGAVNRLLSEALGPSLVLHDMPAEFIHNTTRYWDLGPSNSLLRSQDTDMHIHRSPRELRMDGRELFSLCLQHSGTSVVSEEDGPVAVLEGSLCINNLARQHEVGFRGQVDCSAFMLSHEQMGLPLSVVDRGARRLDMSPLYPMVREHIARVCSVADTDELPAASEAAAEVASATIQLIRAMVASTNPENAEARDVVVETKFIAVLTYLRQHLRDPSLTPQQVATANQISVRQLYKLWSAHETSLNDWVLRERLEISRTELASPGLLHLTIEVIARRSGFSDPSHFSRRFRRAYGMTPREWRASQTRLYMVPPTA